MPKINKDIVKEVRKILESYFKGEEYIPKVEGKAGVFVTLKTKDNELRSCIGIPFPMDLRRALREAAIGALFDPRFPPVERDELDNLKIEVSILSEPEAVEDPLKEIKIGKHGIIISRGTNTGLLLPQVAIEHNMDLEEFLDACCLKAGLPPKCWKDPETLIMRFEADVFEED